MASRPNEQLSAKPSSSKNALEQPLRNNRTTEQATKAASDAVSIKEGLSYRDTAKADRPAPSDGTIKGASSIPYARIENRFTHRNVPDNDAYRTEFVIRLTVDDPLPTMSIEVAAASISEMRVLPQRVGGGRPLVEISRGVASTRLEKVFGAYLFVVRTENPEDLQISVSR